MVTRRTAEETARLGDEIYERDIRQKVEADHQGAVVAIDVESGNWAIGDNVIAATDRSPYATAGRRRRLATPGRASCTASLRRSSQAECRVFEGVVNAAHEAVLTLALHGPTGQARDIEAVIDTGFLCVGPVGAGCLAVVPT